MLDNKSFLNLIYKSFKNVVPNQCVYINICNNNIKRSLINNVKLVKNSFDCHNKKRLKKNLFFEILL